MKASLIGAEVPASRDRHPAISSRRGAQKNIALLASGSCVYFEGHTDDAEVRLEATLEQTSEDTFRTLSLLLRKDLDFSSHDSTYASHAIHPFAAKFPPQIPRLFIDRLTESGDSILDPMAGSGTTIVEALILRRQAFGFDIDPLAVRRWRVKTVGGCGGRCE
jgi:hypothetical protein